MLIINGLLIFSCPVLGQGRGKCREYATVQRPHRHDGFLSATPRAVSAAREPTLLHPALDPRNGRKGAGPLIVRSTRS